LPLGQVLQAAAEVEPASVLNVPDSQATHAKPVKEYWPLEQVTHEEGEVEPVAAVPPCPAAQGVHAPRLPAAAA
jgi:hypothetical protein